MSKNTLDNFLDSTGEALGNIMITTFVAIPLEIAREVYSAFGTEDIVIETRKDADENRPFYDGPKDYYPHQIRGPPA